VFDSLRSRLILSYVLIVVVCLVIVGLSLAVLLRGYQERLTYDRLKQALPLTARLLQRLLQRGIPLARLEELRPQEGQLKVRVFLVNQQGTIVADSEGTMTRQQWPGVLPRQPIPERSKLPLRGAMTTLKGEHLLWVAAPLFPPDEEAETAPARHLWVVLAAPSRQARALTDRLTFRLALAGGAALVLSLVLALVMARSIARPLQQISQATEAIARGDYNQRLDITSPEELRRLAESFNTMAQAVQASQQAQRDFVANVSHDLKTPLTAIRGFAQAILDGTAASPEEQQRAASIIYDEAERMSRLVGQLLDLAKLDAGQMTLAREPVDLSALLHDCAQALALQAQEKGVDLQVDAPPLPPLLGDADRLAQVFSNLLDNAIRHTPSGGRVTLHAEVQQADAGPKASGVAVVTVTDTGSGIPPEDLPRIFERFYQVDKSRARRGKGTGLGLAIAKELVQAHGGTIKAESVVGLGTRFTVTLPILADRETEINDS